MTSHTDTDTGAGSDGAVPHIRISDAAAALINEALSQGDGLQVHLHIDATWQHDLRLAPASAQSIRAVSNGIELLMDADTARRADGLGLDVNDTAGGRGLAIDNPNMPPPVRDMAVEELAALRQRGEALELVDVRTPGERQRAVIEPSTLLDAASMERLQALPGDTRLVFYCHSGVRSAQAAEHFRRLGFTDVYNLRGGIDAWSLQVDPSVPRY